MITSIELRRNAEAKLLDSEALLLAGRFDAAVYLCGYAVEIALKAKICKTLQWTEFPLTNNEFKSYQSFRTHDLDILLKLSGIENSIKTVYFLEWSDVSTWEPESRYFPVGTATRQNAELMIKAARILLGVL